MKKTRQAALQVTSKNDGIYQISPGRNPNCICFTVSLPYTELLRYKLEKNSYVVLYNVFDHMQFILI